jgi:hypothetical protein
MAQAILRTEVVRHSLAALSLGLTGILIVGILELVVPFHFAIEIYVYHT